MSHGTLRRGVLCDRGYLIKSHTLLKVQNPEIIYEIETKQDVNI